MEAGDARRLLRSLCRPLLRIRSPWCASIGVGACRRGLMCGPHTGGLDAETGLQWSSITLYEYEAGKTTARVRRLWPVGAHVAERKAQIQRRRGIRAENGERYEGEPSLLSRSHCAEITESRSPTTGYSCLRKVADHSRTLTRIYGTSSAICVAPTRHRSRLISLRDQATLHAAA
jgi:hypothetical protein